jgi:hypothetical protein
MKIVTYATHSEGLFEGLRKHDVIVLGWGTKWNGFMDKFNAIRKFLDTQPPDEIVVFVDGFDSKINGDIGRLEETFRSMNCRVLVSRDQSSLASFCPGLVHQYITKRVFGVCKGNHTANTGLYMGYAKELKQVIDSIKNGDDDQKEFNSACSQFDFIKVDTENIIFENCSSPDCVSNAMFVQYPGTLSWNRILRSMQEYPRYFIPEILLLIAIIIWLQTEW